MAGSTPIKELGEGYLATPGTSFHDVTEIVIVGVATPYGMLAIEPSVVYTLLKVEEERA